MTRVASALGVSRPHLSLTVNHPPKMRGRYTKSDDDKLIQRIRGIVDVRQSYG